MTQYKIKARLRTQQDDLDEIYGRINEMLTLEFGEDLVELEVRKK